MASVQAPPNFRRTPRATPPIHADMTAALQRTGISLKELLVWRSAPRLLRNVSKNAPSKMVTVVPGLCRLCSHRQYMELLLSSMSRSAIVFLLQSDQDRTFAACLRTIQLISDNVGTSIVVGRQWLSVVASDTTPCNHSMNRDVRGTFPRVQMQARL